MAQTLGVVHILVSREAAEHRLTQHADQCMAAVLAGTRVSQCFSSRCAQTERVIEFAIGEQTGIRCYNGPAKLHHHAAIKIDAQSLVLRSTRRVRHMDRRNRVVLGGEFGISLDAIEARLTE